MRTIYITAIALCLSIAISFASGGTKANRPEAHDFSLVSVKAGTDTVPKNETDTPGGYTFAKTKVKVVNPIVQSESNMAHIERVLGKYE